MFPYTHDTGAVTGTEPGFEIYILPLTEINIADFQTFNTALFKPISILCFSLDNIK